MKIRNSAYAAILVGACTVLAPFYGPHIASGAGNPADELEKSVKSLAGAYALLEQNFADRVDSEKAIYSGAIPGMLRTLDPHSRFFDPKAFNSMREDQQGRYYGLGISIAKGIFEAHNAELTLADDGAPGTTWIALLRHADVAR